MIYFKINEIRLRNIVSINDAYIKDYAIFPRYGIINDTLYYSVGRREDLKRVGVKGVRIYVQKL